MTGSNNVYKAIWKNSNKKEYNEKYISCFLLVHIYYRTMDEYCYSINQFALPSANSHCHFHILFIYHYFMYLYFQHFTFPLLFNWSQSKAGVIYQMSNLFFVKFQPSSDKRTNCWNVQTTEKANLCALSNIIYIKF